VLETTFVTGSGGVRVTDALTLPDGGLTPYPGGAAENPGARGHVPLRRRFEPRFGYGARPLRLGRRHGIPIASSAGEAVAVYAFDVGEPDIVGEGITGRFDASEGTTALVALTPVRRADD
jgi:hypothetical protein